MLMINTSRLVRLAAAMAALVVAGAASAQTEPSPRGTFTGEVGLSYLTGKTLAYRDIDPSDRDSRGLNLAVGWEHPSGFGVRALFIGDLQFRSIPFVTPEKSFDNFIGVQATGSLPLAESFKLKGGLGLGRSRLDDGTGGDGSHETDGVISAGLQWRPASHFALELRVDHLTKTGITATSLMAQVPF
jgi:Outer membrane protein beta-barrel domain